MKHARKMILVDAKTNTSQKDVVEAINSLVKTTEFSRANFGSNAIAIAHLDTELKDLLARDDLPADARVREYNQRLQKYLFLLRESEKSNSRPNPMGVPLLTPKLEEEEEEDRGEDVVEGREPDRGTPLQPQRPLFEGAFGGAPVAQPNLFSPPVPAVQKAQARSNLPRTTPMQDRLRKRNSDRKNKRYDGYFVNWSPYGGK